MLYHQPARKLLFEGHFRQATRRRTVRITSLFDTPKPPLFRGMYQRFDKLFFKHDYAIVHPVGTIAKGITAENAEVAEVAVPTSGIPTPLLSAPLCVLCGSFPVALITPLAGVLIHDSQGSVLARLTS